MALLLVAESISQAGVEPPAGIVDGLASERYPRRVQAQKELAEWAGRIGDESIDWLLAASRSSDDPEVRNRAFEVLRYRVKIKLDGERPGFIGITMVGAEVNLGGAAIPAARVTSIQEGSPADRAELEGGDAIIAIDGERWRDGEIPDQLAHKVGGMKPGREIRLTIVRDEQEMDLTLKLGARPWEAGEWGEFRQLRIDPFSGRPSLEKYAEEAREKAFQRWLEQQREVPDSR